MREYTVKNNDFTEFDSNPDLVLTKVDRNNTHYYTDTRCHKCGGEGYLSYYNHVDGGVCFLCGGTGKHNTKIVVRTEEYAAKLAEQRLEKARKTAGTRNAEYLRRQGFSVDGMTWVVMGETYTHKEELKAAGCRWNPEFGWHFDHDVNGFYTALVTINDNIPSWDDSMDTLGQHSPDGTLYFLPSEFIQDYIKKLREKYIADHAPKTEYFGSVGDKVNLQVKLVRRCGFDTAWGVTFVYTFVDSEGHQFVWKTSTYLDIAEGDNTILHGTIKAHSEYRGSRQTELTRCKVE